MGIVIDGQFNHNPPSVMHIDLNSCFATIEQQAHPSFRGKPLVMAAYNSLSGCVVAPSIEAKKLGIKVGMSVRDAKSICREVIVRTPDVVLIRDVHIKFRNLFREYSSKVIPKSIDEAIIDFANTPYMSNPSRLIEVAKEIKKRMRDEIGEWLKCSIGISTNRFLAKTGASFRKPDGLVFIDHKNIREIYSQMKLVDITGINVKYEARLNSWGIYTPLDFLDAGYNFLQKQVFKSVVGVHWYLRLRGWEVDDVEWDRKSFGQNYSLPKPIGNLKEFAPVLMKLCEKMGRRLRHSEMSAKGVHVGCVYADWTYWHKGRKFGKPLAETREFYAKCLLLLNEQPAWKPVSKFSVSCYDLVFHKSSQLSFFDNQIDRKNKVAKAMDVLNDKYGEFVVTPAVMMGMNSDVIDRISFGGVKELESLYESC